MQKSTERTCANSENAFTALARPTRDDEPHRGQYDEDYSDSSCEWVEPGRTLNASLRRFPKKTEQSDGEYGTEECDSSKDRDTPDGESGDKTHPFVAPEPSPQPELEFCAEDVKLIGFSHHILRETGPKRLQVIVKLANVHLTPDNSNYPGGWWHTEGQINEHIALLLRQREHH
ncbi:WD40 repeat 2 [Fusarium pseudoanthophilum]|uniref:WD40 repeat 2 n=1 Tax=Fusarium pseudoanthophilum TaxID=48495 RepID=A0A8H5UWV0_9HYPO|nr:WD40 repeat 2 [Fusarium pseudoanthophilum]